MSDLENLLLTHRACPEAVKWASEYPDLPSAWAACPRGDWMLWLAAKAELCTRQQLVLAACECARLSLKYVPADEVRPLRAIETAEAWARGEATLSAVRDAAYAAASAAAYDASTYAAYAAGGVAAAAAAASAAAYAAYAAASAASASAYAADAARMATLKFCSDIVRRRAKEELWRI